MNVIIQDRNLNYQRLRQENQIFAGTGGVSEHNGAAGFLPAFQDTATGRIELARLADGAPAPMHLLDGVPPEWVIERDDEGRIVALKPTVITGFVHQGQFYTRAEAAAAVRH